MNNAGFSVNIMSEQGYVYQASIQASNCSNQSTDFSREQTKLGIWTKYGMVDDMSHQIL